MVDSDDPKKEGSGSDTESESGSLAATSAQDRECQQQGAQDRLLAFQLDQEKQLKEFERSEARLKRAGLVGGSSSQEEKQQASAPKQQASSSKSKLSAAEWNLAEYHAEAECQLVSPVPEHISGFQLDEI